jgi:hypothetical protein
MRRTRIGLVVLGSIVGVLGLVAAAGAGIVLAIGAIFGGETTSRIQTPANAVLVGDVVAKRFELGSVDYEGDFEIELTGSLTSGETGRIFLGVGPSELVSGYLDDVPHIAAPLFSSALGPGGGEPSPAEPQTPAPPTEQTFWAATASGTGEQTLAWGLRNGAWTFVVMRADGESGVSADVAASAGVPGLDWVGRFAPWLLGLGAILIVVGVALVVAGVRGRRDPPRPPWSDTSPDAPPLHPTGRF